VFLDHSEKVHKQSLILLAVYSQTSSTPDLLAHDDERNLDVFSVFISGHHLYNKVCDVRRNGLLTDVLDKRAELHRESLLTLLLADKRAPEHADPLADHANVELVLLLEPRDDLFESGVILEFETVPQRPLRRPVLVLLGRYRFREAEER